MKNITNELYNHHHDSLWSLVEIDSFPPLFIYNSLIEIVCQKFNFFMDDQLNQTIYEEYS